MTRLPSTALIFSTALSMSLAGCTTVPTNDNESEGSSASELEAIQVAIDGLKTDIQELSDKVDALPGQVGIAKSSGKKAPSASPEDEAKGKELATQITDHIKKGEMAQAKKVMDSLKKKYPTTSAYKALQRRTAPELAVIGKAVSHEAVSSHIEEWYVDGAADLDSGTTLVVFWEIWCPHCKREMPELIDLYNARKGQGLKILGLTRLTKSATEEKVKAFIAENKLIYPIAKENGKVAPIFNVSGIPAAAVVQDGKIIWRGHPNNISDTLWDKWLK